MSDEPEFEIDEDGVTGIWVTSDLNPDGSPSYIVTVSAGIDLAVSLKADQAVRYCAAVNRAAVIAKHDAAVVRQMRQSLGLDMTAAGMAVQSLRDDREPLAHDATAPFRFTPIVSGSTFEPYVHVFFNGAPLTQWTPQDCFQHAGYVMEVLAGADLDSAYLRYLTHTIGVPENTARGAVHDLGNQQTGLADR